MDDLFFFRYRKLIYGYVVTLFIILLVTSIMLPHMEGDELVYQTLGSKLSSGQLYSLQDTALLKYLSPDIYNTPIFFRPPLFSIYLAVLYKSLGVVGFRIAPVLVYMLLCFALYKIVYHITKSKNTALKSLVLSTTSTLMLFSSVQIRLDLFMTLMATISFYYVLLYRNTKKYKYILYSGLFLVFAVLTNYTAIILYPFFLFAVLYKKNVRTIVMPLLVFVLPVLLIVIWFYLYFIQYHMTFASLFSKPSATMLEKYAYIRYVHDRPFYYYFLTFFIVNPIYLFVFSFINKIIRGSLYKKISKFYIIFPAEYHFDYFFFYDIVWTSRGDVSDAVYFIGRTFHYYSFITYSF